MSHCLQRVLNRGFLLRKVEWANGLSRVMAACATSGDVIASKTSSNHNGNPVAFRTPEILNTDRQIGGRFKQSVRCAGHSHWHNIRHIKGAMDKVRAKHNIRITQKIRIALKDGGIADPKLNKDLERAFQEGKSYNVPMAFMLDTVKRLKEGKEKGSEFIAEAKGHGNCFFMIECFSDKPTRTRKELGVVLKKYGGSLVEVGAAGHMFDRKGVIYVKQNDNNALDEDKAEEIAIEVGAEDVRSGLDEEQQERIQFFCDRQDLHSVKKALEDLSLNITDARLEHVPKSCIQLTEMEMKIANNMLNAILELEDVIRVYDNIEGPEEENL